MRYLILLLALTLFSCNRDNDIDEDEPISEQRNDNAVVLDISLSGSLQNPAFSPDNHSIIFTRFINGYNKEPAEIYKYDLNTKQLILLVSDGSANVNLPGSSWNHGKIVFSSSREPHDEIYMISENGQAGDEIRITNRTNRIAYEPTLSPDGEWVVFESHILDVEGDGMIIKYKMDGTSAYIELSNANDDCRQPNWSPNNNKILYQRLLNGQWNIWTMDTDGTNKTQLTSNIGNCTDACFSADGQYVVFSSDYQVNIANIYRISIDGTNPIRLSNYNGYDGAVSISNDASKLVFESRNGDPDESSGTKILMLNAL